MFEFENILNCITQKSQLNFSGYRKEMLERRFQKRMTATGCNDLDSYYKFLCLNEQEVHILIDTLTINVSHFFRNALTFEYIRKLILPGLIVKTNETSNHQIRIWSAGCSYGEEPYSIAILLNEMLSKESVQVKLNIFATDIDQNALEGARKGTYGLNRLENVKTGILNKFFNHQQQSFEIKPEIKEMVNFYYYDLLDKKSYVPNESIFGGFDVVFCRNVLIYFNPEYQQIIFNKLYKSLNIDGILVLGEAETPIEAYKNKFKRESLCCKIYRKVS